jgi:hypothetical protein
MSQIRNIQDVEVLKKIVAKIQFAENLDEIKEMLI